MILATMLAASVAPDIGVISDYRCAAAYFKLGSRYARIEAPDPKVASELLRRTTLFWQRAGLDPALSMQLVLDAEARSELQAVASNPDPDERSRLEASMIATMYERVRACDEVAGLTSLIG